MPAGVQALAKAVMAARRQLLEVWRQWVFEGAAGHADRTEDPILHDVGECNPGRIGERQLLDHDATTGIMGSGKGRSNQSDGADIGRRPAVEYLRYRRQRYSGSVAGEPEAVASTRGMAKERPRRRDQVGCSISAKGFDSLVM